MTHSSALDRAVRVLADNQYLVLATHDNDGPWSAALAHTLLPSGFYFVSLRDSRHVKAIMGDSKVSGVIFDSRAKTEDVESIQFSGIASCLDATQTQSVLSAVKDADEVAESISEHCDPDSTTTIVHVSIDAAWVLDQEAWERASEDRREPVDILAALDTALSS